MSSPQLYNHQCQLLHGDHDHELKYHCISYYPGTSDFFLSVFCRPHLNYIFHTLSSPPGIFQGYIYVTLFFLASFFIHSNNFAFSFPLFLLIISYTFFIVLLFHFCLCFSAPYSFLSVCFSSSLFSSISISFSLFLTFSFTTIYFIFPFYLIILFSLFFYSRTSSTTLLVLLLFILSNPFFQIYIFFLSQ